MTRSSEISGQVTIGTKALNGLFDDAIDELEITYDVYFEIDSYRPRCIHVARWLISNGIRKGKVLVFGSYETPFSMFLEKLGFQTEVFRSTHPLNDLRENEHEAGARPLQAIGDLRGEYDIVICDDILQNLRYPEDTLYRLKKHVCPGGMLMLMTPNVARGTLRLRLLTGRNIYPQPIICETEEGELHRIMPYREYTRRELEALISDNGFELMRSEFIIGKTVNANMWPPMPVKEYFFQTIFLVIQKIAPPLRNYLFVAARRPLTPGGKNGQ